jgi:hypothetical protein
MANLATVHAFRWETVLAQSFPSLGAVHGDARESTVIGRGLGDILETRRTGHRRVFSVSKERAVLAVQSRRYQERGARRETLPTTVRQ